MKKTAQDERSKGFAILVEEARYLAFSLGIAFGGAMAGLMGALAMQGF